MKAMSAREAKNSFGLMIDTVRAEQALIVVSVEEYERLSVQSGHADKGETGGKGRRKVANETFDGIEAGAVRWRT